MDVYEERVDLIRYFRVIGKRKGLIVAATLSCALLGFLYGFLEPVRWRVDAVIQGGRFFNPERHEDIILAPGEVLAGQINAGYYQNAIASELKVLPAGLPAMKAKILRWTERVEVAIKTPDPEAAKRILNTLLAVLRKELDKKIDFARVGQEAQVKQYEKIVQEETDAIQKRESEIDRLRRAVGPGADSAALRQWETEVGILRIVRETHRRDMQQLIATFAQSEPTQFIQEPTVSPRPVSPRKVLNLLIAGLLGFVIFTLLTFFLDHIENLKKTQNSL
jgi:capsular polysaccharide biosynthesis protein